MSRSTYLLAIFLLIQAVAAGADDHVDYLAQIQPLFSEHCAKCHGTSKSAAKLKLDSADNFNISWQGKPELVVAGEPDKSELLRRLLLPADDDEHMPKGQPSLPKDFTDALANWIKQGAMISKATAADAGPDKASVPAPVAAPEQHAPANLPVLAPAPPTAIELLTSAGAQVMPLYSGSSLLQISFSHRTEPVGDAELALLREVAEQAYSLDLAGCKATKTGFVNLAELRNLTTLHLENSTITDTGLASVAPLANLVYLNLYGTAVTDEGIAKLSSLKKLKRLYLWQTKATFNAASALESAVPGLAVDLGYNNPEVVRRKLTVSLDELGKQLSSAKAEIELRTNELEDSKKKAAQLAERRNEIQKQLDSLNQPTASSTDSASTSK